MIGGLANVLNILMWSTIPPLFLMLEKYINLGKIKGNEPLTFAGYGLRITFEFIKNN